MKKLIPVFSPIIIGLFGGLFVECALCAMSLVISPFVDSEQTSILIFLMLIVLLSALFIALMAVANVAYLINLNNNKRAKLIAVLEAIVVLTLFFVSWSFSGFIIDGISKLF